MKSIEREATLVDRTGAGTTYADEETSLRRENAAREEKQTAEKPKVSEEIMIEEISIDGMCGVY